MRFFITCGMWFLYLQSDPTEATHWQDRALCLNYGGVSQERALHDTAVCIR